MINRIWIYIITCMSYSLTVGMVVAYSMIKQPLSYEFGFSEGLLGLCDSMNFLGHSLGFILFLIKPLKKPKRDFLISSLLNCAVLTLIPLCSSLEAHRQIVIIFANLLSGFFRVYIIAPYLIVIHHYDPADKDRKAMNIWGVFTAFGDVFAIIFLGAMLKYLKWDWKLSFYLSIAFFLLIALMHFFIVDEVDLEQYNKEKGVKTEVTLRELWQMSASFFTREFTYLWLYDFLLIGSVYYSILAWFPYYFVHIGYEMQYIQISLMYPLFFCIGSVLHQYLTSFWPEKQAFIIAIQLFLNCVLYFVMVVWGTDKNDILYIVLTGFNGLFTGGPYGYINSSELFWKTKKQNNFYYPYTVSKLLQKLSNFLIVLIIGFFMQINLRSFLTILLILSILNFLVFTLRKFCLESQDPVMQVSNQ